MVANNHVQQLELDFSSHPKMHVGLDCAHCPDCNKEFQPWSKEYSQALQRSRGYQVGDRVTILQESPSRIYKIVKLSGAAHAHCQPLDDPGGNRRRVPFWKIRPACAVEDVTSVDADRSPLDADNSQLEVEATNGSAASTPLTRVSGVTLEFTPDTCGEVEVTEGNAVSTPLTGVSGVTLEFTPDTCGEVEVTEGNAVSTPLTGVSGVNLQLTPDTCGEPEATEGSAASTPPLNVAQEIDRLRALLREEQEKCREAVDRLRELERERTNFQRKVSDQQEDGEPAIGGAISQGTSPTHTHSHWVEVYRPNRRRTEYYRYVWMEGQRLRHLHISGGHIRSCSAQGNMLEVELAIMAGRSPTEIKQLISELRSGKI